MKLIIDIDEKTYNKFKKGITDIEGNLTVRKAVRNATPLQAELEEIKAEIEVIHNRYKINFQGYSMSVAKECMDILDKRIKEIEE